DDANSQIKLACPNDISSSIQANADYLVRSGNLGKEITGLKAIFTADNMLYGIDRSQNKWMNPTIIQVNGEISENVMQKAIHEVDRKAGGTVDFWLASLGVSRAYGDYLLASRQ